MNRFAVKTGPIRDSLIRLPGSKSYTHRTLIAAALAEGTSRITGALFSEDTELTMGALRQFGAAVRIHADHIAVGGTGGDIAAAAEPVYLHNSGTSMRLLAGVAALGRGATILTGSKRMQVRPIGDLITALAATGVEARSVAGNGCPPIEIANGPAEGGRVAVDCSASSQYLSALLLMAPMTRTGMEIHVTKGLASRPYVDMTMALMQRFGVAVTHSDYRQFRIAGQQRYRSGRYQVEADASQAGYFWAAGAISGRTVAVSGLDPDSVQGDVRLADIFGAMGCRVDRTQNGIAVTGGRLKGITVDMNAMPDSVPTLAVVASFADGQTVIKNVGHLRIKESDRLAAVAAELKRLGVTAAVSGDDLHIVGGGHRGAEIETYDDHRMAMSFAVAGLMVPGIVIQDPSCVRKSFPKFWEYLDSLYAPG
jgi:3-phosphoshikimate 1-carboxyvinyltransferase